MNSNNLQCTQEIRKFQSYAELSHRINIPSMQRSLIEKHVRDMENHIFDRASRHLSPIFGAIDLADLNGNYYVIDGQHRLAAIESQYSKFNKVIPIIAVIYHVQSKEEMIEIFTTRNKGIPVPDFITNPSDDKTLVLKKIQAYIETLPGFDYRQKKRPYVNITEFMTNLRGSKMLSLIENEQQFRDIFVWINDSNYTRCMNPNMRKSYGISEHMVKLCTSWNIWIGVDKNMPWFDDNYNLDFVKELLRNRKSPPFETVVSPGAPAPSPDSASALHSMTINVTTSRPGPPPSVYPKINIPRL